MSNYLIILSESASFPWGMAASNRVRNLGKGLLLQDWIVKYIGLRGADVQKMDIKYKSHGELEGISYCYPGRITLRPYTWWMRRIDDILGWLSTLLMLFWEKYNHRLDDVLFYTRNENIASFWLSLLHMLNIPVVLEMCEWPLAIAEAKGKNFKVASRFCHVIVPAVDAVLPISSYICREVDRLAHIKNRSVPTFKIPILIDVALDNIQTVTTNDRQYMLYCGSYSYMDIARLVVDIVYHLTTLGCYIPVIYTGKEDAAGFAELKKYANQMGVLPLFEFTGFIAEDELNRLMGGAACLLAPMPINEQSESRFPTKIGYYLASGAPVVTNGIGEVNLYLKDNINAFVTEQCEPTQFANKILEILNDPIASKKIGLAGRELALKTFHFSLACKGLGDFIRSIVKDYKQ